MIRYIMSITEHMVTGQDLSVISYNFLGIFYTRVKFYLVYTCYMLPVVMSAVDVSRLFPPFLLLSICYIFFITLRTSCGTVYCNQSCLWVGVCVCMFVGLLPR